MSILDTLTRRQRAVYEYLRDHEDSFEQPPTLDELCEALDLQSRGSLHKHIQALIDAGLVEPMNRQHRGLRLRRPRGRRRHMVPFYGYIAAGRPIEAIANHEDVEIPPSLRTSKPCYVLQVKGDSMIDDGILDGDWVVVEQREEARNGEIVVALVDGEEATLKRILQRRKQIVLCPANSNLAPMTYPPERVQIQGVVVGQMRSYR